MIRKIIFSFFCIVNFISASGAMKPYRITNQNVLDETKVNITTYLYWLDENDTVPFNSLSGGVNQSHRFLLYLENSTNDSVSRVIRFDNRFLYAADFKVECKETGKSNSESEPTNSFFVTLSSNQSCYVSFALKELNARDPKLLSLTLLTPQRDSRRNEIVTITQSFFLGLFAFLTVFNLVIYLVTKWNVYLKYSCYIFFAFVYFSFEYGIAQSIFPSLKLISFNLFQIWVSMLFITYFNFVNGFGNYKEIVPRGYKLLNIGIAYKFIETVLKSLVYLLGGTFIYSTWYKFFTMGFEIVLIGFIIFYILKNKDIRGKIVIAASFILILGGVVDQLYFLESEMHPYIMEIAVAADLLAFSVGLGFTTKKYYQENQLNQQLYIDQLKEAEKIRQEHTLLLEEKVKTRTGELEKKNRENELLLGEIHHRVKNNLQTIYSLLSIQQRKLKDTEAKEVIEDSKNRVMTMGYIHEHLYKNTSFAELDFKNYAEELIRSVINSHTRAGIDTTIVIPHVEVNVDNAIFLGLILNELVMNSVKHAFHGVKNPKLKVELKQSGKQMVMIVQNNGRGKKIDMDNSNSFGWKMISSIAGQLNARFEVFYEDGVSVQLYFDKEIIRPIE